MSGEALGVPSIAVMTDKFVSAAELMARVLGADGYPLAVIPHPISSASEADLASAARTVAEACLAELTVKGGER